MYTKLAGKRAVSVAADSESDKNCHITSSYLGLVICPHFFVDLKELPGKLVDLDRLCECVAEKRLVMCHLMRQLV